MDSSHEDWGDLVDAAYDNLRDRQDRTDYNAEQAMKSLEWKPVNGFKPTLNFYSSATFINNDREYVLSLGTGRYYGGEWDYHKGLHKQDIYEVAILDHENFFVTSRFFHLPKGKQITQLPRAVLLEFLWNKEITPLKPKEEDDMSWRSPDEWHNRYVPNATQWVKDHDVCPSCKGDGWVEHFNYHKESEGSRECTRCNGNGFVIKEG